MTKKLYQRLLFASLSLLAVFLIHPPSDALAKSSEDKPVLAMYNEEGVYPDWKHQSLAVHFLLDDGDKCPDYEIPDPSQAIVWRSTDSGQNWYDITGTADASLTSSTLTISNLDEDIIDPDADNSGYCFQIELPEDGPVDRYSTIFRVFLLDEETLYCVSDMGGNRGGGNRHLRPPSVTEPPQSDDGIFCRRHRSQITELLPMRPSQIPKGPPLWQTPARMGLAVRPAPRPVRQDPALLIKATLLPRRTSVLISPLALTLPLPGPVHPLMEINRNIKAM